MLPLLLASLAESTGIILSKYVLSKLRLPVGQFSGATFLFLAALSGLTLPWLGNIAGWERVFSLPVVGLLIAMVAVGTTWNLWYYRAIKHETIEEFEIVFLLTPLLTVLLSVLVFQSERQPQLFLASLIASGALIFTHFNRKRQVSFNRYSRGLILAVLFMAIESLLIKQLLTIFSPALLYFLRTSAIFLVLVNYFRPRFDELSDQAWGWIFLTAASGVVYKILQFYGYRDVGLVYTTLILILSPLFVLVMDSLILKEKIHWRNLAAILIILGSIIYGTILK